MKHLLYLLILLGFSASLAGNESFVDIHPFKIGDSKQPNFLVLGDLNEDGSLPSATTMVYVGSSEDSRLKRKVLDWYDSTNWGLEESDIERIGRQAPKEIRKRETRKLRENSHKRVMPLGAGSYGIVSEKKGVVIVKTSGKGIYVKAPTNYWERKKFRESFALDSDSMTAAVLDSRTQVVDKKTKKKKWKWKFTPSKQERNWSQNLVKKRRKFAGVPIEGITYRKTSVSRKRKGTKQVKALRRKSDEGVSTKNTHGLRINRYAIKTKAGKKRTNFYYIGDLNKDGSLKKENVLLPTGGTSFKGKGFNFSKEVTHANGDTSYYTGEKGNYTLAAKVISGEGYARLSGNEEEIEALKKRLRYQGPEFKENYAKLDLAKSNDIVKRKRFNTNIESNALDRHPKDPIQTLLNSKSMAKKIEGKPLKDLTPPEADRAYGVKQTFDDDHPIKTAHNENNKIVEKRGVTLPQKKRSKKKLTINDIYKYPRIRGRRAEFAELREVEKGVFKRMQCKDKAGLDCKWIQYKDGKYSLTEVSNEDIKNHWTDDKYYKASVDFSYGRLRDRDIRFNDPAENRRALRVAKAITAEAAEKETATEKSSDNNDSSGVVSKGEMKIAKLDKATTGTDAESDGNEGSTKESADKTAKAVQENTVNEKVSNLPDASKVQGYCKSIGKGHAYGKKLMRSRKNVARVDKAVIRGAELFKNLTRQGYFDISKAKNPRKFNNENGQPVRLFVTNSCVSGGDCSGCNCMLINKSKKTKSEGKCLSEHLSFGYNGSAIPLKDAAAFHDSVNDSPVLESTNVAQEDEWDKPEVEKVVKKSKKKPKPETSYYPANSAVKQFGSTAFWASDR